MMARPENAISASVQAIDRKPTSLRQEILPEKVKLPLDDDGLASVNVGFVLVARTAFERMAQDLNRVVDIDGRVPILNLAF